MVATAHHSNGFRIRLGIEEFALITGLKFKGKARKRYDAKDRLRWLIDAFLE